MPTEETPPPAPTGIEKLVCDDIARRQAHGRQKYGMTVAQNPLPLHLWLKHGYEEALDSSIYLRRAMEDAERQYRALILCHEQMRILAQEYRTGNGSYIPCEVTVAYFHACEALGMELAK